MKANGAHVGKCTTSPQARAEGTKVRWVVLGTVPPSACASVRELGEGLGVAAVGGVAGLQGLRRGGLPVRLGGGGVGAFARAAARLCAGAGLLHFPPLGQRGLVDILKAKPLSLVFVKGLGEKEREPL